MNWRKNTSVIRCHYSMKLSEQWWNNWAKWHERCQNYIEINRHKNRFRFFGEWGDDRNDKMTKPIETMIKAIEKVVLIWPFCLHSFTVTRSSAGSPAHSFSNISRCLLLIFVQVYFCGIFRKQFEKWNATTERTIQLKVNVYTFYAYGHNFS